ncbi:MAG: HAD family hydrolase [Candidatus Adiutrix sp.]
MRPESEEMTFTHAIFDLDMTLFDSTKPLAASANLLAGEFGLRLVTNEEVSYALKSTPSCTLKLLWSSLWGFYDESWHEFYGAHLIEEEYKCTELYEDGQQVLETLFHHGVILGIASNRDYPQKIISALALNHFFTSTVGILDVLRPKPAPDMIIKSLAQMKGSPETALYIGDSLGDIQAASAAGVKIFAMTTGGHSAQELSASGAFMTGDNLSEILPFFKNTLK